MPSTNMFYDPVSQEMSSIHLGRLLLSRRSRSKTTTIEFSNYIFNFPADLPWTTLLMHT